jgi:hypothetical protein
MKAKLLALFGYFLKLQYLLQSLLQDDQLRVHCVLQLLEFRLWVELIDMNFWLCKFIPASIICSVSGTVK